MKIIKVALILFSVMFVGCTTTAPSVESGRAAIEVTYFSGVNSSLSARVSKIERVDTGEVVYRDGDLGFFSGNSIELDQGEYLVSYRCRIDTTQVASMQFSGNSTPEFTERYKLSPGEALRLSHQFQHNIKYGNHCKPIYRKVSALQSQEQGQFFRCATNLPVLRALAKTLGDRYVNTL